MLHHPSVALTEVPLGACLDCHSAPQDSFALVDSLVADREALGALKPRLCLEIGSGSGYCITSLGLLLREAAGAAGGGASEAGGSGGGGHELVAVDVSPHAVAATRETLTAHGVEADVVQSDLFAEVEGMPT
mmetsp:Transcript_60090/g.190900  ORF Transcript_60090/g.190900 Transcript_60090/m.190900 type:complete len:132 (-) Transcript_60090:35-430(-)